MPQIDMHIVVDDNGALRVSGFPLNPMQAMGLLECAKQSVMDHFKQLQNEQRVQPVSGIIPGIRG